MKTVVAVGFLLRKQEKAMGNGKAIAFITLVSGALAYFGWRKWKEVKALMGLSVSPAKNPFQIVHIDMNSGLVDCNINLLIKLKGATPNKFDIGARIRLFTGNASQVRDIRSGSAATFSDEQIAHFGLGTAIEDKPNDGLSVYPQPAFSKVHVLSDELIQNITIIGPQGEIIKEISIQGASEAELPISEFTPGIYFLKITTETRTSIKKLLVISQY